MHTIEFIKLYQVPVVVAGVHSCSPAVPQKDTESFINNDDILIPELGDRTEITTNYFNTKLIKI